MIKQFILTLDTPLPADAAYSLYSALLAVMPESLSNWLHDAERLSICQYVNKNHWYLSLMGDVCITEISPVIDALDALFLYRFQQTVHIVKCETSCISSAEALLESSLPNFLTLHLQTPTAFKSANQYQLLPTQQLIVNSLIQKWNNCFGAECPIEDEGGGAEALAEGLQYQSIQLDTKSYHIKGVEIPGAVGTIQLKNHLTGFHRQLADALLQFGTYSGIGIKTRLGMGGIRLDRRK